ncbi:MAG: hypothetical protein ACP5UR_16805 [Chloroflexus sp.]|uniref:hypothetical protein n=1 Tax=Chloroflexus sp. TaxID=1904827 RepID=UPI003C7834A3
MFQLLGVVAIGYALICAALYAIQERLIFFSERDPPGTQYHFGWPADEVFIPVEGATHYIRFGFALPIPKALSSISTATAVVCGVGVQ